MAFQIEIKTIPTSQHSAAQEFYKSVQYFQTIQKEDTVFGAYIHNELIGVVRLAPEHGVIVLRGMMIHPSQQRNGIGTLLLKELEKYIRNRECFCLPHGWLISFYEQIGFKVISDNEAPEHLQKRLSENRLKYPQLIVMKRGE